ncbi:hypothetical protein [Salinarimonas soli]|uniref:Uncharacterized protein n=1 Tax=Salinarimonas soli TaxID=1638099 RepID=A0A5B2W1J8_9HYPH|nr:hypothetical protein [Salinarimonas soli]KAA2244337.1 hypothetical protein F0L46_00110 [Salinarimonas soli]
MATAARRMLLVLAGVIAPISLPPAHAQTLGVFEALFSGGPVREAALPSVVPDPVFSPERARAARAMRRARQQKAHYARLPPSAESRAVAPTPAPAPAPARGAILDTAGAIKAVLADPTLRAGDIVVFPDGPKVFTGETRAPHRLASFEDVGGSRSVSKGSRAAMSALGLSPPSRSTAAVRLRQPKVASGAGPSPKTRTDQPRVVYQDATPVR